MASQQPLAPFVPAVLALAVGLLFDNPMPNLEAHTSLRLLRAARAGWCLTVLALAAGATAALLPLADPDLRGIMIRNAVLLNALAIITAVGVGSRVAWLAVLLLTLPNLLAGTDDDLAARPWAILLHSEHSMSAAVITGAVAAVSVGGYIRWDTRPLIGLSEGNI
jgi:hypothetical protein